MSIAREWENVNNTECMRKRKGKEFILKLISLLDIVFIICMLHVD